MSFRTATLLSGLVLTGTVRLAIGHAGINQEAAQEAPAGFNTPSFNGGQSNGIAEPAIYTLFSSNGVYANPYRSDCFGRKTRRRNTRPKVGWRRTGRIQHRAVVATEPGRDWGAE